MQPYRGSSFRAGSQPMSGPATLTIVSCPDQVCDGARHSATAKGNSGMSPLQLCFACRMQRRPTWCTLQQVTDLLKLAMSRLLVCKCHTRFTDQVRTLSQLSGGHAVCFQSRAMDESSLEGLVSMPFNARWTYHLLLWPDQCK